MAALCARLETSLGLIAGALDFELMIETPQAIVAGDRSRAVLLSHPLWSKDPQLWNPAQARAQRHLVSGLGIQHTSFADMFMLARSPARVPPAPRPDRIGAMEAEIRQLRDDVSALQEQFAQFRKQFE